MKTVLIYFAAAFAEIAGCFAFWAWFRLEKSVFWLAPGMLSLAAFAWLLALSPADQAGRAYAVYGGVYIVSSLFWLWGVEGIARISGMLLARAFALSVQVLFSGRRAGPSIRLNSRTGSGNIT